MPGWRSRGSAQKVHSASNVILLILDEAAFVPADLIAATFPMLAVSAGRLIMLSSCYGKRGPFWEAWRGPIDGTPELNPWLRVRVSATECPRISQEFLAEMRGRMTSWKYRSEFLAGFLDPTDAIFADADIERMYSEPYMVWDLEKEGDGSGFIWPEDKGKKRRAPDDGGAVPAAAAAAVPLTDVDEEWELGSAASALFAPSAPNAVPLVKARPLAAIAAERAHDPIFRWQDAQQARGGW
jgi:hypothetical protein